MFRSPGPAKMASGQRTETLHGPREKQHTVERNPGGKIQQKEIPYLL